MTNIRAHVLLVVAAALIAPAWGATSKPITLELKLPKRSDKPAVEPPTIPPPLTAAPVSLVVLDARGAEDPSIVGGQRIKGKDVYFWRVAEPVAPAVAGVVTQMLHGWSVIVGPDEDLTLRLGLMRYYVNERSDTFGSTYIAEVRLMLSVTDRDGTVLWTGEATGDSKRAGVDARASMCNEALSYALIRALAQGLSAVKLDAAPAATESRAAPAVPTAPYVAPAVMIEPPALFDDLTKLLAGGVTEDVLVAYVEQRKLTRPLTVDEILKWKNAGIPDAAIKAATKP
jgi:hypothetical protein